MVADNETYNTLFPIIEKTSSFVENATQATKHTAQAIERLETDCRERQNELFDQIDTTLKTMKECLMANVPVDDGHGSTIAVGKTLAQIIVDNLNKQAKKDEALLKALQEVRSEIQDQNKWLKYLSIIGACLAAVASIMGAILRVCTLF